MIFAFSITLNIANAVVDGVRTTWDTIGNGSFDCTRGDYTAIGGQANGSTCGFPAYDNTSLFYQQSSGPGTRTISVGEFHVNMTADTEADRVSLTSGLMLPNLGTSTCIGLDMQLRLQNKVAIGE